jgi:hypothetical protein
MARLQVRIERVVCITTEDLVSDEIYVIAAAAHSIADIAATSRYGDGKLPPDIPGAPGGSGGMIRDTISMSSGDVWRPGANLLDLSVDPGPLCVGLWLFDQDAAADIDAEQVEAAKAALLAVGAVAAAATKGASIPAAAIAS